MNRSITCALFALAAAAPATAQTSKPAAPAAASPAAQDALAAAWKKATAAKLLQSRVLAKRHFVAKRSRDTYVVDVGGKLDPSGVAAIEITMRRLSRAGRIVFRYELDADGRMRKFSTDEVKHTLSGKKRAEVIEAVVADGQATVTRTRDGKPRKGGVFPWPNDALPMVFAWFVIPSLHDQGIGRSLQLQAVLEERIRRISLKPMPFARVTEAPQSTPAGKVHRFEIGSGFLKAEVEVETEGKHVGQVRSVRVGKSRHFVRASAKEVEALLATAPLFRNELEAANMLRQLYYTQDDLKRRKKPFATKLEDIAGIQPQIKKLEDRYLILFRALPDGSKWAAIAVPVEQGKTGRFFFAITQDGRVHSSKTKLELTDDCSIPKGATPHR